MIPFNHLGIIFNTFGSLIYPLLLLIADNSYDAVILGEALHHFRDVDLALFEIGRILKKDEKLFTKSFFCKDRNIWMALHYSCKL